MCAKLGSEVNDAFTMDGDKITTTTNNSGGIQGGITNGLPLVMQVGIKPTPSIYKEQHSVSLSQKEDTLLTIQGRHDPCVALRAVPVIEAVIIPLDKNAVRLMFPTSYTPPKLMKLCKSEPFCIFHHHNSCIRHINSNLYYCS